MKVFKENKGIMISGCLLVLLSVCFMLMISCELYYDGNIALMSGYFIRTAFRLCVSAAVFALAYRYGEKFALEYGRVLIPIGIAAALLKARWSIDILPLTNTFAVLGFAVYFYKYCVKSAAHTVLLWLSLLLFLSATESGYLSVTLTVMLGFALVSVHRNGIGGKKVMILNLLLYAVLLLQSAKIAVTGITQFIKMFYSEGYMAAQIRDMFGNVKLFGAVEPIGAMGGNAADYSLARIFGLYGIAAGTAVLTVLTAFVFLVCRKGFGRTLTDKTPVACAAASILVVRYVLSVSANFGLVLDGLFAPIPILSDGLCGYVAIFTMIGIISGKECDF